MNVKPNTTVTPSQFGLLWQSLDMAAARHRVASMNIANINTPEYLAREVEFELPRDGSSAELQQGLTPGQSRVVTAESGPPRADGNNVDIDHEMGEVTRSELMYQTFSQILASRMATMRSAITGR